MGDDDTLIHLTHTDLTAKRIHAPFSNGQEPAHVNSFGTQLRKELIFSFQGNISKEDPFAPLAVSCNKSWEALTVGDVKKHFQPVFDFSDATKCDLGTDVPDQIGPKDGMLDVLKPSVHTEAADSGDPGDGTKNTLKPMKVGMIFCIALAGGYIIHFYYPTQAKSKVRSIQSQKPKGKVVKAV